jgi:outer membrane protein assembly factor BamB
MKGPSAPHRSHVRGGALQRGRSGPFRRRPPARVIVWAAATVVLLVVSTLLWRGSDAAATESTTASPADVPTGTPAGAVSENWSAEGEPTAVAGGRVLVGSRHGVRALNPVTGEEAWHYTRSNARMCGLTATDGVAVAVFASADRCDEAVALHADTGVRAWTRSLLLRSDATLMSTDRIVMATSPTGVVTIDPTGDNIRWRYAAPSGCRFLQTAVGSAGVAVLQSCSTAPIAQLRLFDGFSGTPHWTRDVPVASRPRLLGADTLPTLLADGVLQALSPTDGAVLTSLPVPAGADVQVGAAGALTLVRVDGQLTALAATSGAAVWSVPARGLPSSVGAPKAARAAEPLLVPDADAVVRRDPATGVELGRSVAPDLPQGGTATGIGPVVVLQLPDRVRTYR